MVNCVVPVSADNPRAHNLVRSSRYRGEDGEELGVL